MEGAGPPDEIAAYLNADLEDGSRPDFCWVPIHSWSRFAADGGELPGDSTEEGISAIRAAVSTREELDPEYVVVAPETLIEALEEDAGAPPPPE
jgi:hypothetical protein